MARERQLQKVSARNEPPEVLEVMDMPLVPRVKAVAAAHVGPDAVDASARRGHITLHRMPIGFSFVTPRDVARLISLYPRR